MPGSAQTVSGQFVKVPQEHRHRPRHRRLGAQGCGRRVSAAADGRKLAAGQPNDDTDRASTGRSGCSSTGASSTTSSTFVRVEDIAYDKRPGMENVVYIVDSGRGTAGSVAAGTLDERPRLEDGARLRRPDEGDVALRARRGRRHAREDAQRGPPAGQHRVDAERSSRSRRIRDRASSSPSARPDPARDDCAPVVGAVLRRAAGRREGRPVGRRRLDRRRRPARRQLGRVGVERHRRRLGGVRPRRVPDRRPGAHAVGREGSAATTTTATVSRTSRTSARAGSSCCSGSRARSRARRSRMRASLRRRPRRLRRERRFAAVRRRSC